MENGAMNMCSNHALSLILWLSVVDHKTGLAHPWMDQSQIGHMLPVGIKDGELHVDQVTRL